MRSPARILSRPARVLAQLLLPPPSPGDGLGIIVYPYDPNPYQAMLYDAMRTSGVDCTVVYVQRRAHLGPLPFLIGVTLARLRGYRLLHLHWTQFALHRGGRLLPRASLLNARLHLWLLQALGITLVWTVHNAVPHEPETADDVAVSRRLARDAARKIVHSATTIEALAAIGADAERITVIPHGAYTTSYREAGRAEAREALRLPGDARIALFFGQIRPYKGLDDLFPAWDAAAAGAPGASPPLLLVAGKCDDEADRARLQREVSERRGRFDQGYASEDEVPLYFAAADVVVFPFRRVTTSGSAVLALSLGRPIVAPRIGALRDLPQDVGFLYEDGGLTAALGRALSSSPQELAQRAAAARRYAGDLSWDHIAAATMDVYRQAALRDG